MIIEIISKTMRYKSFQLFLLMAFVALFSCSDPAAIGADLLEEDEVNLQFTTDVPVQATLVDGAALQTYSPFVALQLNRHLFGNFEDPLLGITEASIYTQIALGAQTPPAFAIPSFDSIVLSLAYDTLGGYGDISEEYELEVFQLEEAMSNIEDYFSDQTFLTGQTPIGTVNFVPAFEDSVTIREYIADTENGELVTTSPHIRIHLENELLEEILSDTSIYSGDVAFQNAFKGIHIRPSARTNSGLLSFDFSNSISRISLYYKLGSVLQEFQLDFNAGNARVLSLAENRTGSFAAPFLAGESDSLLFLQGMIGPNMEITFPDLSDFENIVVNKAELELTVANIEANDTTIYPVTPQILASFLDNADRAILPDVRAAIFGDQPIQTNVFGGNPVTETENGVELTTYKINVSGYFQQIVEGTAANGFNLSAGVEETNFYFQLTPKPTDPSKVVFYGPNHPTHPLRLNLTFTRL